MFKLFRKKLNKKGFTLAELLVVVAIVAILAAIAIPVFTGFTTRAKKAVKDANLRAVRAAAVEEILMNWDTAGKNYRSTNNPSAEPTAANAADSWKVSATVNSNGDIIELHIIPRKGETAAPGTCSDQNPDTGNYQITDMVVTDIAQVAKRT